MILNTQNSMLSCIWIETGNPAQPLACVWMDTDLCAFEFSQEQDGPGPVLCLALRSL
jgi:hypothetical protein